MSSDRISPTAHYTGYAWFHHGLSHPGLVTHTGRLMHTAGRPVNRLSRRGGLPSLDGLLLARHHAIDARLAQAIEDGQVSQVIEVACGLSARGWRFMQRFGDRIDYVETDLPDMAARKLQLLQRHGLLARRHHVQPLDVLADDGAGSLPALCATLDPNRGVAIVTEGLLNYFSRQRVTAMWSRFASNLQRFPHGRYLSDLHLASENTGAMIDLFTGVLGRLVRDRIYMHFTNAAEALEALDAAGFDNAGLPHPEARTVSGGQPDTRAAAMVRIVDARTGTTA